MARTTDNYGWDQVDSGADPVSAPQNFQHVQQIDTTLASILGQGQIVDIRVGTVDINPTANVATRTDVTVSPPMQGDNFKGFVTAHTSVPGEAVMEVAVDAETANGFRVMSFRDNDTGYSVHWMYVGVRQA